MNVKCSYLVDAYICDVVIQVSFKKQQQNENTPCLYVLSDSCTFILPTGL